VKGSEKRRRRLSGGRYNVPWSLFCSGLWTAVVADLLLNKGAGAPATVAVVMACLILGLGLGVWANERAQQSSEDRELSLWGGGLIGVALAPVLEPDPVARGA
jgi:hypothetical protein